MKEYPLVKFTLLFIGGIVLQYYSSLELQIFQITFLISLVISVTLFFIKKESSKRLTDLSIFFSIIVFGGLLASNASLDKSHYPFKSPKIKNGEVYGEVYKIELIRDERLTFYIAADSIRIGDRTLRSNKKIMSNIYDKQNKVEKLYDILKIGNKVKLGCTLSRARNTRNPYEFDYEKYLSDRGIAILATSYKYSDLNVTNHSFDWFGNTVFEIRNSLDNTLSSLHNKTTRGLLRGLLLADRSGIDYNTNTDFMNAGVVHVLSVSGLHVGYIVIIFLFLFNRFNLYWRLALTIIGLFFYMIITGSEAPVFRSTIMASVILITPFLGRDSNSYNTLSLAALIILLFNPLELFNPSFQLSFSAILALIVFFPMIKRIADAKGNSSKLIRYLLIFLGSTLIAQIGTLPFTLVYFGRVSITSLLANFVVIPASGIIVALGVVSLMASTFSLWLANAYSSCNELLTYLLFHIVRFFGNPDYSFITINQFTLYDSIIFYLTLGVLVGLWKYFLTKKSKIVFVVSLLCTFFVFISLDNEELLPKNKLSIVSLDVGQGDAFLVKFPNGETALIDAGEATKKFDNGKRIIMPLMEKLGIDKIDYALISHVDSDHYMGILSLIKGKKVKKLYKPEPDSSKQNDLDFESILKRNQIPIVHYKHEDIAVGNSKLYFLACDFSYKAKSSNDRSGIVKLVYGKTSILFTGDAGKAVEREYIQAYKSFLKSDVLKVSHHGSKTSSSLEFLQQVSPKYALISAGVMNKFHHPSGEVLDRLRKFQTKILRTDILGASILSSNGAEIEIIDWRKD